MEICANNYVYERNRAGFDITQKKQTIKMTDLIAYLFALKDLENKLSK